jgi:antirestriction protein
MSRIYIADLAAYNSGRLVGRWVDMTENADVNLEAIEAAIQSMQADRPGSEEFVVHDYDDGINLGETSEWEKLATFGALFEEHGDAFRACVDSFGARYIPADYSDAESFFEERYRGEYPSVGDYAEEFFRETGGPIPEALEFYIDWAAMGRDWSYNGDITVAEFSGGVYIFTTN